MPRFDGTGPRGAGPMTGRGEGYCVLELLSGDRPARGYAGRQGAPVGPDAAAPTGLRAPSWPTPAFGRGRAARRGRRRFSRW